MIQDIFPKKFDNQYKNIAYDVKDNILVFSGRNILLRKAGVLGELFPVIEELKNYLEKLNIYYVFSVDDKKFFIGIPKTEDIIEANELEYVPMSKARSGHAIDEELVIATGWHLNVWYRTNRFCGCCGKPTVHDTKERMLRCECGNLIFPKIAPAVIVGVIDGDRIMLTTYANREYTRYALIAGFNEIGESVEETVRREVKEEVGLDVCNIRYYKSQPWGFDSNLLVGFYADVDYSKGNKDIVRDGEELATAQWVKAEDVPDYGENLSLTHEMMKMFKLGACHNND